MNRPLERARRWAAHGPYPHDPENFWTGARYIREPQECAFCGTRIPRDKPGTRTGERGTKAYYNGLTKEWECTGCRRASIDAYCAHVGAARPTQIVSTALGRPDTVPPIAAG